MPSLCYTPSPGPTAPANKMLTGERASESRGLCTFQGDAVLPAVDFAEDLLQVALEGKAGQVELRLDDLEQFAQFLFRAGVHRRPVQEPLLDLAADGLLEGLLLFLGRERLLEDALNLGEKVGVGPVQLGGGA